MWSPKLIVSAAIACGTLSVFGGCGKAAPPMLPSAMVTGTVTLDDEPAVAAMVRFIPEGNTKGFGGFAVSDERGQYLVENAGTNSLPEGKYKVLVSKFRVPEDPVLAAKFAAPSNSTAKIPRVYGEEARTPLTAIVATGGGPIDFKLDSKKK